MYHGKNNQRFTIILFIIYLAALYWILLLKLGVNFSYMASRRSNLVPFNHSPVLSGENILNLIVFMPLGIYIGVLFRRLNFFSKLFLFFLFSFTVEIIQYVFRLGAFDITDIITNTSGAVLGLLIYEVIKLTLKDNMKTQKFINVVAAASTAFMILLLVLLKLNMLPIRYQ